MGAVVRQTVSKWAVSQKPLAPSKLYLTLFDAEVE